MGLREPHGAPGQWSLNPMISSTPVDLLVSEMSGLTILSTRLQLGMLTMLVHELAIAIHAVEYHIRWHGTFGHAARQELSPHD